MNSVDRVKLICKERKIAISRLERDLGYANGYIGQLRKGSFPADRLAEIAEYLSVSSAFLITGEEEQKNNAPSEETLTEDELRILLAFRAMSPERRKALADLVGISDPQK